MKEKQMKEKRLSIKALKYLVIVAIIIVFVGSSYALFTLFRKSSRNNTIKVGNVSLAIDSEQNEITLTDDVPFTDKAGLKTTPYTFKIINNGSYTEAYNLYLTNSDIATDKTRLADDFIKYRLDLNSTVGAVSLLSSKTDGKYGRIIDSGILTANESKSYALRLWVNGENISSSQSNTEFSVHISLDASQLVSKDIVDYVTVDANGTLQFKANINDYFKVSGLDDIVLQPVTIPSQINNITIKSLGSSITNATCVAPYMSNLVVPYTVQNIYSDIASNCSNFNSLIVESTDSNPSQLSSISNNAFINTSLTGELILPSSLTSIGSEAFENTQLASISFKDGSKLNNIGKDALAKNNYLTSFTMPNSSFTLTESIFSNDNNLTIVNFNGTISQWNTNLNAVIKNNSNVTTIHCTDGDINL